MAEDPLEGDALWEEFHRVVNMTSQELSEWLRTDSAAEDAEELPERSGTPDGRSVLAVLQKRRTDLTGEDLRVMREVVREVGEQRRDDLEPVAGQEHWRHRLMRLGHDPLKPPR
ncbi:DUF3140 domain-containing protein [Streptomyces durbertensis]|uniref:DUF3140 domain-containing protein n=1 Tax=Streptomyces durbertensis TaxID=2448886 RepID=A0ABR6EF13_9ACTN|nr:DUF3140 domain-containing protein [Streptomyces durbertensis]MBB1243939.1 DUF3140 domain-containing protein [Streptomyces durbertensis]